MIFEVWVFVFYTLDSTVGEEVEIKLGILFRDQVLCIVWRQKQQAGATLTSVLDYDDVLYRHDASLKYLHLVDTVYLEI